MNDKEMQFWEKGSQGRKNENHFQKQALRSNLLKKYPVYGMELMGKALLSL
ncbi:MAG: hypothetical protein SH848_14345 [Saprospiraceae bacterium]|nr:hypothetical protein [Saprospiraceae bacterium]MDZ4705109.1 hypothetical protein [Saprospiraceae bacterium]